MALFHMIPWELAELSQLLKLYDDIYHTKCSNITALLDEIRERISNIPNNEYTEKNPRGAGRRKKITPAQITAVINMRSEKHSIREIAFRTGISVGSVHKLINEHHNIENEKSMKTHR